MYGVIEEYTSTKKKCYYLEIYRKHTKETKNIFFFINHIGWSDPVGPEMNAFNATEWTGYHTAWTEFEIPCD